MSFGFPELLILLLVLLSIGIFVFEVLMLIDAITNKKLAGSEKVVWVLLLILIPGFMSLAYYFMAYSKRKK